MASFSVKATGDAPNEVTLHRQHSALREALSGLTRPFADFMAIPSAILMGFALLGVAILALERANPAWIQAAHHWLSRYLFANSDTTRGFLGAVSSGWIAMVSLTISMLLIVLQQLASNMGNLIYDQFLSRRQNQMFVGYIVGVVFLALFLHGTVKDDLNPVVGATIVLGLAFVMLFLFILFVYSIIQQMRPETVIGTIRRKTMAAREKQRPLVQRTRREPQVTEGERVTVRSAIEGHITEIDLSHIAKSLGDDREAEEIVLMVGIGSYVAYHDVIATVIAPRREQARQVAEALGEALRFEEQRDIEIDAAYGLEQLEMTAWTELSSAKDNPEIGLMVADSLRTTLRHWMLEEHDAFSGETLPIVYPDSVPAYALTLIESLMIAASESYQHQGVVAALHVLTNTLPVLTPELRRRAQEVVVRTLPTLKEQTLSHELDQALMALARTLEETGAQDVAQAVRQARDKQAQKFPLPVEAPSGEAAAAAYEAAYDTTR